MKKVAAITSANILVEVIAAFLTRNQHANRLQAQRCLVEHGQALLAAVAQGVQLAGAHAGVDRL